MPPPRRSQYRTMGGRSAHDYKIVIAYDGERTEDEYFRSWKLLLGQRLSIEPLHVNSGGNPLSAVRQARKRLKGNRDFAEFWCVSDVDDTPAHIVTQAYAEADAAGIKLCLSQRCFEVWIGLHFGRSTAPITCEAEAIALVSPYLPEYRAGSKVASFGELFPRTEGAIENGAWLQAQACTNPSSAVHHLVRKLHANIPKKPTP